VAPPAGNRPTSTPSTPPPARDRRTRSLPLPRSIVVAHEHEWVWPYSHCGNRRTIASTSDRLTCCASARFGRAFGRPVHRQSIGERHTELDDVATGVHQRSMIGRVAAGEDRLSSHTESARYACGLELSRCVDTVQLALSNIKDLSPQRTQRARRKTKRTLMLARLALALLCALCVSVGSRFVLSGRQRHRARHRIHVLSPRPERLTSGSCLRQRGRELHRIGKGMRGFERGE